MEDFQDCYQAGASLLGNMLTEKGTGRPGYGNKELQELVMEIKKKGC